MSIQKISAAWAGYSHESPSKHWSRPARPSQPQPLPSPNGLYGGVLQQEQAQPDKELAAQEQFDTDFMLMAGELNQLLADLGQALGGQPERQAA